MRDEGEYMADKNEFSFMEEQVMESKRKKRHWVSDVKKVAVNGAIFGAMSALGFGGGYYVMTTTYQGELDNRGNTEEQVVLETSQQPQPTKETSEGKKADSSAVVTHGLDFSSMESFYQEVGKLANRCKRSIVGVENYDKKAETPVFYSEEYEAGVIVAETGKNLFILTDYDAVNQEDGISITFFDGKNVNGSLGGVDSRLNLAIVKVPKQRVEKSTLGKVRPIQFADSTFLDVGDMVFAFGCPNGNLYSAEYGYVTGECSVKNIEDYQMDVYTTSMNYHSKASGMICDAEGTVLGWITTKEGTAENCTFYGISKLRFVIENLINHTDQIYAGVTARDLPDAVMSGHNIRGGIYVEDVSDNSPAYEAGIHVGDILYAVDGEILHSVTDYFQCLQRYGVGAQVEMTVLTDPFTNAKEKKLTVTLQTRE